MAGALTDSFVVAPRRPDNASMTTPSPDLRLRALIDAGIALASELELPALLRRIADLARSVVGARYAAVAVLGEREGLAEFVYSGIDEAQAHKIGDLPRGRGVLGVLIEEGRPLRLKEISDHPRSYGFPEHHPPMHSFLGVPIVVRGRIFGRLYLTEKTSGEDFTKDDERLAEVLAAQAGVAVDNARLYQEVVSRSAELARAVSELSSVERLGDMLIGLPLVGDLLATALEESVKLTGATKGALLLLDEDTGEMVVREALGADAPVIDTRLAPGMSKAHAVLERLQGETSDDLAADPELHSETMRKLGNPSKGAWVPLAVHEKGLGVIAVYDRVDGSSFSDSDLVILQMLANQTAIALENERLRERLRDMAVLEERERISKELHDGVIQSIYSVGLSLQGSLSMLDRDPETVTKRVSDSIAELDNVVRDVRTYIFELQPKMVEEHGLAAAIESLAREYEVNTLAHVELRLDDSACDALPSADQVQMVQIVREILSNIARHANATEVSVTCSAGDAITLEIVDNGVGFDPTTVRRGQGLRNIEERAHRLRGTLEIVPAASKGTRHTLKIPIQGEERADG